MISSPDAAAELLTDEDLKKAALDYLKSYETTQAHLRTILLRKVQRKIKGTAFEAADFEDAITRTIPKLKLASRPKASATSGRSGPNRSPTAPRPDDVVRFRYGGRAPYEAHVSCLSEVGHAQEAENG